MISSQTIRSGRAASGARDRDALALAARELARDSGRPCAGRQPHELEQAQRLRARLRAPEAAEHARRRATISSRRVCRGLSDSYGFWKTIWHAAARSRGRSLGARGERLAVEQDPCRRSGWCSPTTQRAIVVLPLPDSPTSATHSPGATANEMSCGGDDGSWRRAGAPPSARRPRSSGACSPPRRPRARGASPAARRVDPLPLEAAHGRPGATASSVGHLLVAARHPQRAARREAQPAGRSPTPTATPGMPCSRRGTR